MSVKKSSSGVSTILSKDQKALKATCSIQAERYLNIANLIDYQICSERQSKHSGLQSFWSTQPGMQGIWEPRRIQR